MVFVLKGNVNMSNSKILLWHGTSTLFLSDIQKMDYVILILLKNLML